MSDRDFSGDAEALRQMIVERPAVLVLFGSEHCQVCHAIRPRLAEMLAQRYPEMSLLYVDCARAQDVCAQQQAFSLPVVRAYIGGQRVGEWVRAFSPVQIAQAVARPYRLFFDGSS